MNKLYYTLSLGLLLAVSCGKSTYDITEPNPSLEVNLLQDRYVIDEPVYLQLRASQKGYSGSFQLSAVANEGKCDIFMSGSEVPTSGEWVRLDNAAEILTITPRQAGPLRLSFEVKSQESMSSGISSISLKVSASAALSLSAECPQTASISKPVEIVITASKKGFSGAVPTKFEQLAKSGTLQFGAVTVPSGETFSLPANTAQTLYYTPAERGVHKFQFTATDGYTTEFKTLEIIITN